MLQHDFHAQPDFFQNLFDNHPDGLAIVDLTGRFIKVNVSLLTMFGYTQEEMLQTTLDRLLDAQGVYQGVSGGNAGARSELAVLHKNGCPLYVRLTCIPYASNGKESERLIKFEDITAQRKHSRELSDIQEMFAFISEKSQNIISSYSGDGVFTYISPTVKALLGYTPEEVIGKPVEAFNHPDDHRKFLEFRSSVVIDQDTERFTGRVRHKSGEYRWYETTTQYIRDESGAIVQIIGVGRDVTDRKEAEETISHLAYHDTLTDLPNRRLFQSRTRRLCEESGAVHGLLLLDLDGFKCVNDTFGHDVGDLLLIEVSRRLTKAVGDKGFVARWGGDEFTILQANLENKGDMASLTSRIEQAISEPLLIAGHTLTIDASIGVSYFPEDGDSLQTLIRHADAAMYRVKHGRKIHLEQEGR